VIGKEGVGKFYISIGAGNASTGQIVKGRSPVAYAGKLKQGQGFFPGKGFQQGGLDFVLNRGKQGDTAIKVLPVHMKKSMGDRFYRSKGPAVFKAAQKIEPVFAVVRVCMDEKAPVNRGRFA
jgi:hypothetical protein